MKIPRAYYELMNMGLYPSEYAKYCPSDKRGEINFSGISRRLEGQFIAITGVIDKINPPLDMMEHRRFTCPICNEHVFDHVDVQFEGRFSKNYAYRTICPTCSELYYVENTTTVDGDNNSVIVEMEQSDEYYSAQHLVISNPHSYRKIDVVYLTSDELTKNDIGKTVTCSGILNFFDGKTKPLIRSDKIKIKDSSEKGIIEDEVHFERDIPGYTEWRNHILNRDKVCVVCGGDKNLHAHHLFGYKENPSLRVHTENGVAVCQWCHEKYHSYYGVKQINPVDFIKFVHRFGVK